MTENGDSELDSIIDSIVTANKNIVDHEDDIIEYKSGEKINDTPEKCVDVFMKESPTDLDIILWGVDESTKSLPGVNKNDFDDDTINKFEKEIKRKSNSDFCGLIDTDIQNKPGKIILIGYSYTNEVEKNRNMFSLI